MDVGLPYLSSQLLREVFALLLCSFFGMVISLSSLFLLEAFDKGASLSLFCLCICMERLAHSIHMVVQNLLPSNLIDVDLFFHIFFFY